MNMEEDVLDATFNRWEWGYIYIYIIFCLYDKTVTPHSLSKKHENRTDDLTINCLGMIGFQFYIPLKFLNNC